MKKTLKEGIRGKRKSDVITKGMNLGGMVVKEEEIHKKRYQERGKNGYKGKEVIWYKKRGREVNMGEDDKDYEVDNEENGMGEEEDEDKNARKKTATKAQIKQQQQEKQTHLQPRNLVSTGIVLGIGRAARRGCSHSIPIVFTDEDGR